MGAKNKTTPYRDVPAVPQQGDLDIAELTVEGPGPVELEIGFGKGRFLLERAAQLPDTRFLGIETRRKWVHLVAERARKRDISNVTVMHGDARYVLPRLGPDACLGRVFINFPDPWWKARHAKRMIIAPSFVEQVARLLADGGELFIQTDVDFRARAYAEVLSSISDFAPSASGGFVDHNPYGVRSLREISAEKVALPIYRLLFVRKAY